MTQARLPGSDARLRNALGAGPPDWMVALLLAAAAALGWASDAFTARGRIQLLSPALIGLVAWNLAVYAVLGWHALAGGGRPGPLRRALGRLALPPDVTASGPLQAARLAALLHGAALAWTLGAIASIYVGGLFFEYRAGWSSTFVRDPQTLHALLAVLLWPATALAGAVLPEPAALARLDFALGPGENAARWIHWQTITAACVVLLPRTALAVSALLRARRLAVDFAPAAPDAPAGLRGAAGGTALVLPYSYTVGTDLRAGLQRLLEAALGTPLDLSVAAAVAQGAEDTVAARLADAAPATTVLLLFAATATPERETHGTFLQAVSAARPADGGTLALLDASGWRARFPGADGEARLAARQAEWQRLFDAQGMRAARIDLSQPDAAALNTALARPAAA